MKFLIKIFYNILLDSLKYIEKNLKSITEFPFNEIKKSNNKGINSKNLNLISLNEKAIKSNYYSLS